jgi:hypothetical protein
MIANTGAARELDTITRITPIMPMLWLCRQARWIPCVAAWCG